MKRLTLLVGTCALLVAGCAGSRMNLFRGQNVSASKADDSKPTKRVYLVGHGWHTGLVVKRDDISRDIWPESDAFFDMPYIEVGWGDEGFYRAGRGGITPTLIAKAAFIPTPSVMHIVGLDKPAEKYFLASDIVEIELTDERFDNLCRFIHQAYELDENDEPIWLGLGLYGESSFFRARGSYYFPRTCNVWTAEALSTAGCPILPQVSQTAGSVMRQSRLFGRVIRKSSPMALIYAFF